MFCFVLRFGAFIFLTSDSIVWNRGPGTVAHSFQNRALAAKLSTYRGHDRRENLGDRLRRCRAPVSDSVHTSKSGRFLRNC